MPLSEQSFFIWLVVLVKNRINVGFTASTVRVTALAVLNRTLIRYRSLYVSGGIVVGINVNVGIVRQEALGIVKGVSTKRKAYTLFACAAIVCNISVTEVQVELFSVSAKHGIVA